MDDGIGDTLVSVADARKGDCTNGANIDASVNAQDAIVFVVDDDRRICEALSALLSSFDLHAVTFGSAAEYLAYPKPDVPACLVLDVQLPDINGLDLQSQFAQGAAPPIVFITGHGDIPSSVRAIKAGAVDFLTKPFKEADLMRAIHAALAQSREARHKEGASWPICISAFRP